MKKSAKNSRKPLGDRLKELVRQGKTVSEAYEMTHAEGYPASRATVGRALHQLRGPQRIGRTGSSKRPAPELPTVKQVATTSELATLDQWLRVAADAARKAERRGDQAALARFGQLATAILEAKRKAEPPKDQPEGAFVTSEVMAAQAAQTRQRFAGIAQAHREERNAAPKCTHCGQPVLPHDPNRDFSPAELFIKEIMS